MHSQHHSHVNHVGKFFILGSSLGGIAGLTTLVDRDDPGLPALLLWPVRT